MPKSLDALKSTLRSTQTAWAILGVTLVLLLLLEGGLRAMFAVKDGVARLPIVDPRVVAKGYEGADWVEDLYREQARLGVEWTPYVHYRLEAVQGNFINIGPNTLRRTWNESVAEAEPLRIYIFGGSTAWGMGARDAETIPSHLARVLTRLGLDVEVINAAQIGHVSTQELLALQLALKGGERPDVVVFLDGVNDTLVALQNGNAGGLVNTANRRQEFNIQFDAKRLLGAFVVRIIEDSAMFRLAKSLGNRLVPERSTTPPPPYRHADGADLNRLAEEVLADHQANRELVAGLGRSYGFSSLFFWQPVVFTKDAATPFEQEMAEQYALLRPLFLDLNTRVRARLDLDDSKVPPIHDLTGIFDDDPALRFTDFCHLTEAANRILAEAMAEEIVGLVDEQSRAP